MQPTTVTTIVMIMLVVVMLLFASYGWFGSWDLPVRELSAEEQHRAEIEAAVKEMRAAIEAYEHDHLRP